MTPESTVEKSVENLVARAAELSVAAHPQRVPGATAAVVDGRPHALTPVDYDAILLVGFGGPEGQEDVIPFLKNVTRGRGIPEERLEEVAHHYRHFGGISPINAHNRELREKLEQELRCRGWNLPVLWGNRNWKPYLSEVLGEAYRQGCRRFLAVATSAYSCYSSCRQYREDLAAAVENNGLSEQVRIDKVRLFFDHPGFVGPFVEGVVDGLKQVREKHAGIDLQREVRILFSTHSIPVLDASLSGPHGGQPSGAGMEANPLGLGGAYVAQHAAVAKVVVKQAAAQLGLEQNTPETASLVGLDRVHRQDGLSWQLVYQSRSGPPSVPWLEPDINDVIPALPEQGVRAVLIVPLGFVSDHMEVMWDLDNEARETAAEQGLFAVRTATPGSHPSYVAGLADLIGERISGTPPEQRPALTPLGPWYDVCRPGCCENRRAGFKPAYAGLAP